VRRVENASEDRFALPHIGIAIINISTMTLSQRYVWNPEYGFAWPAIATDSRGNVAIACCCAGDNHDPQVGVGMLTGPDRALYVVTSGANVGAGGHYISVEPLFPDAQDSFNGPP
jgi:hypothetical protein